MRGLVVGRSVRLLSCVDVIDGAQQCSVSQMISVISMAYKIRLHGRRGKKTAESFSREKLRQAPQNEGREILYDPGWYVHKSDVQNKWNDNTHTYTHAGPDCAVMCNLMIKHAQTHTQALLLRRVRVFVLVVLRGLLCQVIEVFTESGLHLLHYIILYNTLSETKIILLTRFY